MRVNSAHDDLRFGRDGGPRDSSARAVGRFPSLVFGPQECRSRVRADMRPPRFAIPHMTMKTLRAAAILLLAFASPARAAGGSDAGPAQAARADSLASAHADSVAADTLEFARKLDNAIPSAPKGAGDAMSIKLAGLLQPRYLVTTEDSNDDQRAVSKGIVSHAPGRTSTSSSLPGSACGAASDPEPRERCRCSRPMHAGACPGARSSTSGRRRSNSSARRASRRNASPPWMCRILPRCSIRRCAGGVVQPLLRPGVLHRFGHGRPAQRVQRRRIAGRR